MAVANTLCTLFAQILNVELNSAAFVLNHRKFRVTIAIVTTQHVKKKEEDGERGCNFLSGMHTETSAEPTTLSEWCLEVHQRSLLSSMSTYDLLPNHLIK